MPDNPEITVENIITQVVDRLKPTIAAAASTSVESIDRLKNKLDRKRKYDTVVIENKGNKEQFNHCLEMYDVMTDLDEAIGKKRHERNQRKCRKR